MREGRRGGAKGEGLLECEAEICIGGGGGEKALGKEQRRANTWTSGSPRTLFQPIRLVSLAERISRIFSFADVGWQLTLDLTLVLKRMPGRLWRSNQILKSALAPAMWLKIRHV